MHHFLDTVFGHHGIACRNVFSLYRLCLECHDPNTFRLKYSTLKLLATVGADELLQDGDPLGNPLPGLWRHLFVSHPGQPAELLRAVLGAFARGLGDVARLTLTATRVAFGD